MKTKPLSALACALTALVLAMTLPDRSNGQAAAPGDAELAAALTEIVAQQAAIADNQAKIDEKIAAIAEEVRVARLFVSRGGGKAK